MPLGHLSNQPLVSLLVSSEFIDTSWDTRRAKFGNCCLQIETIGNHVAGRLTPADNLADFLVQIYHVMHPFFGTRPFEPNEAEADKWFVKAAKELLKLAEQGEGKAQVTLAEAYERGKGVENNEAEALKWYRKAAEQGISFAQYKLYELGGDVEKNGSEASKWLREAAVRGEPIALLRLAKLYEEGRGLEKSKTEALKWYRKAAEQGISSAIDDIKRLEFSE